LGVADSRLYSPPIFRRFLSGGPDRLRLSAAGAGGVLGAGITLAAVRKATGAFGLADVPLGGLLAATLAALLLAALTARWLGNRLGTLAGLAYLSTAQVLLADAAAAPGLLLAATVTAAMGAFALANVAGRMPLRSDRWLHWAFYAAAGTSFVLAGPLGLVFILPGCVLFLITSSDARGGWFFVDPIGIAVFVLLVGVRLVVPDGWQGAYGQLAALSIAGSDPATSLPGSLEAIAAGLLPWTPLAAAAALVGLRQGHYATPLGRFLGCWVLGPLGVMALGGSCKPSQLAALTPPLALIAAVGLSSLLAWCRRKCTARPGLPSRTT